MTTLVGAAAGPSVRCLVGPLEWARGCAARGCRKCRAEMVANDEAVLTAAAETEVVRARSRQRGGVYELGPWLLTGVCAAVLAAVLAAAVLAGAVMGVPGPWN